MELGQIRPDDQAPPVSEAKRSEKSRMAGSRFQRLLAAGGWQRCREQ